LIIRADKAFFEAMQEAGYSIDLATLRSIYEAAKVKRKPKPRADTLTLDMFGN
jgi:hypothetical protein